MGGNEQSRIENRELKLGAWGGCVVRRSVLGAIGAVVALVAVGCPRAPMERPIRVDGGLIRGEPAAEEGGIHAYKGVPYAAPPVEALRWRPPQPVAPWDDVIECAGFCPACPQPQWPADTPYGSTPADQDENCLCLNIWTPAKTPRERLPVMVWLHGGGFQRGAGSLEMYDGAALAAKGVVVVTLNYRLGVLGFLALPSLSGESDHGSSGNYGILDQVFALGWVRRNIASFGGDPESVTVFGESAGATSVSYLMASPLAAGLFERAVGESGGGFAPMRALAGGKSSAEAKGEAYAASLGIPAGEDIAAVLRRLSSRQLVAAAEAPGQPGELAFRFFPNVDGWVFERQVAAVFAAGEQQAVPVIVGSNADEGTVVTPPAAAPGSVAAYERMAEERFGDLAPEFLSLYPATNPEEVRTAFRQAEGDRLITWKVRAWARDMSRLSAPVYRYLFDHAPPTAAGREYGAYHGAEIPYVFDNLAVLGDHVDEADRELARLMSSYWVNLVRSGDPNGEGLPVWPPYEDTTARTLRLDIPVRVEEGVRAAASDFWERVAARSGGAGGVGGGAVSSGHPETVSGN